MKTTNSLALPPPSPSLIAALRAGFDAITNHVILIAFPVALDLFLWLGPHLRLKGLIQSTVSQLIGVYRTQDPAMAEMLRVGQELWDLLAEKFNLLIALRAYPVGIPSLMVSRFPVETPFGEPIMLELQSLGGVLLAWAALSLFGLSLGTFYFAVVAQAALSGQVDWREALSQWPWAVWQVFTLALFWAAILVAVSLPGSCIFSLAALGGLTAGQCAFLLYAGFLMWLIVPILFSTHGIFVNRHNMIASLKNSVRLTQRTLPATSLFFLVVLLISKSLDILWLGPAETSWMTLVGVAGHAFITTGLLAASFVYYRDADRWVRGISVYRSLSTR